MYVYEQKCHDGLMYVKLDWIKLSYATTLNLGFRQVDVA